MVSESVVGAGGGGDRGRNRSVSGWGWISGTCMHLYSVSFLYSVQFCASKIGGSELRRPIGKVVAFPRVKECKFLYSDETSANTLSSHRM